MPVDRQSKIRSWSLGVCLLGLAMWMASIATPWIFGESRGWSAEEAGAYSQAGAKLHDLIEGTHDHSALRFDNQEAAEAFAESERQGKHRHIHVDPAELKKAQAEFDVHKAKLDRVRAGNDLQIGVLFWGGIVLGILGGAGFLAASQASD